MSGPACSIVIPSYNGRALLEVCLASIARHRPANVAIEVIVVDDGSTDGTVEWLRAVHPWARVYRLERNGGFCRAVNAGLGLVRAPFVQVLNNDTEVSAGWIDAGLASFEDTQVASAAPLVLSRPDPSRVDSAGDTYLWFGWPMKRGRGEAARRWIDHPGDTVFGASGSSAFYRVAALDRVGAFDPSYGAYYEDVDLAFRLRWAGYKCKYVPECRILHVVSASYDHRRPDLQRSMARNAERLFWSNMPLPWLILAAVPHAVFLVLQGLWRFFRGRGRAFVLGKLDAIGDRAAIRRARALRRELSQRSPTSGSIGDVHDARDPVQVACDGHLRRENGRASNGETSSVPLRRS